MKRIAIVVTTPMRRQGMTSVVLNLLKNMDRRELELSVLTALPTEEWFCEEIESLGVSFIRLRAHRLKQAPRYIRELSRYLKEQSIDVLHVHGNSGTMWLEIHAAKKAGVPCRIAHSHSSRCLSVALHKLLRPLLVRDMTLGIGCSDLSCAFAFRNQKCTVQVNGVDTERFAFDPGVREAYRAQFGLGDAFAIGHVGNLLPVKNHLFLCRVAEELHARGRTGWRMFFVGEGETREEIEAFLSRHGLGEQITLLGSRSDTHKLYQLLDLLVLPSLYEGFPVVLVEAQTSGLPCLISHRVTSTADLIGKASYLPIDGENAVAAWVDAIEAAMAREPGDRLTAKAQVDAAGFSAKQSADALLRIYLGAGK